MKFSKCVRRNCISLIKINGAMSVRHQGAEYCGSWAQCGHPWLAQPPPLEDSNKDPGTSYTSLEGHSCGKLLSQKNAGQVIPTHNAGDPRWPC